MVLVTRPVVDQTKHPLESVRNQSEWIEARGLGQSPKAGREASRRMG